MQSKITICVHLAGIDYIRAVVILIEHTIPVYVRVTPVSHAIGVRVGLLAIGRVKAVVQRVLYPVSVCVSCKVIGSRK